MQDKQAHLANFINQTTDMIKDIHNKISSAGPADDYAEFIAEVFHVAHTIKGNASLFGFSNLKAVAHHLENLLSEAQTNNLAIDKALIDLIWQGVTLMELNIEAVRNNNVPERPLPTEQDFISEVKKALLNKAIQPKLINTNCRSSDKLGYLYQDSDISRQVYIIKFFLQCAKEKRLTSESIEKGLRAFEELAEVFLKYNNAEAASLARKIVSDFPTLVGDNGQADNFLIDLLDEGVRRLFGEIREVEIKGAVSEDREVKPPLETVRPSFRIEKKNIDDIFGAVYKLELVKNDFAGVRNKIAAAEVGNEILFELQTAINSLSFWLRDILQMLIKIKVTSPRLLLEKMEEVVTSFAKSCGKQIRINTSGKDIFVDRTTIELLDRILPHLVRNCIDHGIEPPEERLRLGKPPQGLISIDASKQENTLTITISDDGRGIDYQALQQKAGLSCQVSQEEAVFRPGLSTSDSVTDVSGRGIGMVLVAKTLEKAGGEMRIHSEKGKGTKFIITFPFET